MIKESIFLRVVIGLLTCVFIIFSCIAWQDTVHDITIIKLAVFSVLIFSALLFALLANIAGAIRERK